jgi:uncharacterized damage-inducible protein DinB
MITVGYVTTLNAYDAWATTRVFETAARLDPSALDAASLVGLGSLRALLVHTVSAAWIWRSRLEGVSPSAQLDPADFPTLAAIRKRWESEAAAMTAFLTQLDDAILAGRSWFTSPTIAPSIGVRPVPCSRCSAIRRATSI